MTFDGRLFLSRLRRNPDYACLGFEVFGVVLCIVALYFCYFHFELMHYHVTSFYAGLGHPHAQHLMGDKLLHGKGVDKDEVSKKSTNSSEKEAYLSKIQKYFMDHIIQSETQNRPPMITSLGKET